ncbi:MAG: flagellar motor switch protein FliG, partial [Spirochaetes bacterium]|nr:flagellar motor switch protein FliG [Spirochaetota bacterium]
MKPIDQMNGAEKAAALLVALGPEVASEIMKFLDEESVNKLAAEIAKIDVLSPEEKEELIGQFLLELRKARGVAFGGQNVAKEIL